MNLNKLITWSSAVAMTACIGLANAADTIKVGVLHSLSGTMAISETTLKDTVLMLVDEQNKKGGLLGKKLEAVVVDPASNWPLFAEKARELISKDKVDVIFGCWTSVSRKSVLPVIEELNGLLFYPVQYEGEESSKNVFYTGAAPNQQAIPAVDYLMKDIGVKRWVLAGTDYVYPRTTNKILEAYLKAKGVSELYVTGLATDYCVRASALDATKNGMKTIVVEDAVKGVELNPGDVEKAISEMKANEIEFIKSTAI